MWLRQFIYVAQSFFQERMLFRFYFSCMNSNPSRNQHFNKFISHAHTTETFNFIWVQFFFLQWIIIAVCCSGSLLLPTTILIYIFLLRFNCFISKNFPFALESLKKIPIYTKCFIFVYYIILPLFTESTVTYAERVKNYNLCSMLFQRTAVQFCHRFSSQHRNNTQYTNIYK